MNTHTQLMVYVYMYMYVSQQTQYYDTGSDRLCLFTTNCQPFWIAQTGSQAALELIYVNQNR